MLIPLVELLLPLQMCSRIENAESFTGCIFYELKQTLGVHGIAGALQRARQLLRASHNCTFTPVAIYGPWKVSESDISPFNGQKGR